MKINRKVNDFLSTAVSASIQNNYKANYLALPPIFSNKGIKWIMLVQTFSTILLLFLPSRKPSANQPQLPVSPFSVRIALFVLFFIFTLYFFVLMLLICSKKASHKNYYKYQFLAFAILLLELCIFVFLIIYQGKSSLFYLLNLAPTFILSLISFLTGFFFSSKMFIYSLENNKRKSLKLPPTSGLIILLMAALIVIIRIIIPVTILSLLGQIVCFFVFFLAGHIFLAFSYQEEIENLATKNVR